MKSKVAEAFHQAGIGQQRERGLHHPDVVAIQIDLVRIVRIAVIPVAGWASAARKRRTQTDQELTMTSG